MSTKSSSFSCFWSQTLLPTVYCSLSSVMLLYFSPFCPFFKHRHIVSSQVLFTLQSMIQLLSGLTLIFCQLTAFALETVSVVLSSLIHRTRPSHFRRVLYWTVAEKRLHVFPLSESDLMINKRLDFQFTHTHTDSYVHLTFFL